MRHLLLPLCVALLVWSCGPARDLATPTVWRSAETFAGDRSWTQDAAANHCEIAYDAAGSDALLLHWRETGEGKAILRKEVAYDLRAARRVALSLHSDRHIGVSLALRGPDGQRLELPWRDCQPGWHRDLHWSLEDAGALPARIERVSVLIRPGSAAVGGGSLLLERLAFDAPVLREQRVTLVEGDPPPVRLPLRQPHRWSVLVDHAPLAPPPDNHLPHLERMFLGDLHIVDPRGERSSVRGVCVAIDAEGRHRYEFRWTPLLAGSHHLVLGWHDGRHWREQARAVVAVDPPAADEPPSFIGVAPDDPTVLADRQGRFFWPVGQNLAWMGDPLPWLDRLAAHGGSLARVWLCPWHLDLSIDGSLAQIDLAAAAELDALFAAARARGIQIQLVCLYHGLIAGDWASNPWNAANGGPADLPEEFWTDGRTRRQVAEWLDYLVQRWGAEPNLFAWELVNEANLTRRFADADIIAWHRQMADHLARRDRHDHLVTTSTSQHGQLDALWDLAAIDLVQVHAYTPAIDATIDAVSRLAGRKPVLLAEFGRDWRAAGDQVDTAGWHLRSALYASWCSPLAGSSMPWWWDTHIAANELWPVWSHFADFIAGTDRRGQGFRMVTTRLAGEPTASVRALIGQSQIYVYIHDPAAVAAARDDDIATLTAGARLSLAGVADGEWQYHIIDPSSGRPLGEPATATATAGRLALDLPAVPRDAAIALQRPLPDPAVDLELVQPQSW